MHLQCGTSVTRELFLQLEEKLKASKRSCIDYCPFTHKACNECGVYRGRHRHFVPAKESGVDRIAEYFKAVDSDLNPVQEDTIGRVPAISFRVFTMEDRKMRTCEISEAKNWDWGDPTMMRLIDGWHVKNYQNLIEILCRKEDKGDKTVELEECPRFMLLSGG